MTAKQASADLDAMLGRVFAEFHSGLVQSQGTWFGKERDCVNRFVMGHLLPACLKGQSVVTDPGQISIEMAVGQPKTVGTKLTANKDVVIWRERFGTCWDNR